MWVGNECLGHSRCISWIRRYEVEHALGQACLVKDGNDAMHDARREFRPLQHHGAPRRNGVQEGTGTQDVRRIPVSSVPSKYRMQLTARTGRWVKQQGTYHGAIASTTPNGSRHSMADVSGSAGVGTAPASVETRPAASLIMSTATSRLNSAQPLGWPISATR